MTIIYQYRVATASLAGFGKLLFHWRGSVYKLVYKEMAIFCGIYTALSLTYRCLLSEQQKKVFEMVSIHCNSYTNLIPVSFLLGFYVSLVLSRWWQQFMNIPWPDHALFMVNLYVRGQDEQGRMIRRTVARYLLFSAVLICRSISVVVMKRFPTMQHIIEAGIATKQDVKMYESIDCDYNKFWVPVVWANNLMATAREEGRITTDFGLRMITEQLAEFRNKCSLCFMNDWVTVPLVYTQVVTLVVYMFFGACLLGRQFLDPSQRYEGYSYDFYVPVFTLLEFFFYMGWLKVAEQLINPFGEDDDDLDINWLIDRHMSVSMTMIDICHGQFPPLQRDLHWDDQKISHLPYTEASIGSKRPFYLGSTYNLRRLSQEEQKIVISEGEDERPSISHYLPRPTSLLTLFSRRSPGRKLVSSQSRDSLLPASETKNLRDENSSGLTISSDKNCPISGINPCPGGKSLQGCSFVNRAKGNVSSYDRCCRERPTDQIDRCVWSSHPDLYWKGHVVTQCLETMSSPCVNQNKLQSQSAGNSAENITAESKHKDAGTVLTVSNQYTRKRKYSCPVFPSPKDIASFWETEKGGSLISVSRAPALSSIEEAETGTNPFILNT